MADAAVEKAEASEETTNTEMCTTEPPRFEIKSQFGVLFFMYFFSYIVYTLTFIYYLIFPCE